MRPGGDPDRALAEGDAVQVLLEDRPFGEVMLQPERPHGPGTQRERQGRGQAPAEREQPAAPVAHRDFTVTVNTPPSLRPWTAGLYISSACAGGRTNTPGVVARATYVALYVPGQSTV